MKGNGNFGEWITDNDGLPAYDYKCNQHLNPIAKTLTTYGYSTDHFHQIGNDRITATVHNGGYVQFLEGGRGFQWLTFHNSKKSKLGGGIALFQINNSNKIYYNLYDINNSEKDINFKRIFGMGYFQKSMKIDNISIEHNICAPFSDDPVLLSEIKLTNHSYRVAEIKLVDFWDIYFHHILRSLIVNHYNRKKFGKSKIINILGRTIKILQKITKTDTDGARNRFDKKFIFNGIVDRDNNKIIINPKFKKNRSIPKFASVAKHNYYPNSIFFSMIQGEPIKFFLKKHQLIKDEKFIIQWDEKKDLDVNYSNIDLNNLCLGIGTRVILNQNESKTITCVFGYSLEQTIDALIKKYKKIISDQSILKWNAKYWKETIIRFKSEKDPWLAREIAWHSYYVRSACYFDEYFNCHKFPQGSIYLFGHGLDGAIRDYVLFLYPIIFIDPKLAREHLLYTLSFMTPKGKLPYSIYGFGETFTRSVHSKPSDLYLFLIWGIIEYIYITRDFNFLNEKVPFYPKSLNLNSTVLERIKLAFFSLFSEVVGFGEHGLIKSNDGDWSDGISFMVKNRKKFIKKGESSFNSTFTLYLILKALPLLEKYDNNLLELCKKKYDELKENVLKTWNSRWFYRGYDGRGNPIGDKNIYLEHHTWLLIAEILEKEQAITLINEIYQILDKPSLIGQYISYPPQKTKYNIFPKGWDVNGGIWHAINSLLTWAYSKYDVEKAYNSLIKNSLKRRAEIYPNIWYGIWSGPDSYIADYAENAGEAFYHLLTPMRDFPLMNLNLHTSYLLSIIKMIGFEADYNSIRIAPKILGQIFTFNSPLLSIESKSNSLTIHYCSLNDNEYNLNILKPKWWNLDSKIFLNGLDITSNMNLIEEYIAIKVKDQKNEIKLALK